MDLEENVKNKIQIFTNIYQSSQNILNGEEEAPFIPPPSPDSEPEPEKGPTPYAPPTPAMPPTPMPPVPDIDTGF